MNKFKVNPMKTCNLCGKRMRHQGFGTHSAWCRKKHSANGNGTAATKEQTKELIAKYNILVAAADELLERIRSGKQ